MNIRRALVTISLALCVCPTQRLGAQSVLYHHPAATRVSVRPEVVEGRDLSMDLYYPDGTVPAPRPAVVFVLAYPDSIFGPLKDYGQYTSWARLVAAEGFVGVLYETSDPEADLERVLKFLIRQAERLKIDPSRIALWSCSGNTALALKYARTSSAIEPAAFVAYYGLMPTPDGYQTGAIDSIASRFGFALPAPEPGYLYRGDLPILIVRAGRDRWAEILSSIDHFSELALRQNLSVTIRNYPEGHHAFDVEDDTAETRMIIKQTLDFLHTNLSR